MGHKRSSGCDGVDTGTVVTTKGSEMATGTAWLAEILIESRVSKMLEDDHEYRPGRLIEDLWV